MTKAEWAVTILSAALLLLFATFMVGTILVGTP